MRWIVVGAGAVGGVVGARLFAAGHEVLLVARGAHRAAIERDGLLLHSPDGRQHHRVPVVGDVAGVDWRPGDVAVLAVKSMDTGALLAALAGHADPATPVLTMQNGVANEAAALRWFANVYPVCVMMPASHLEPGVVVQHSAPVAGLLDVGRYPAGLDDTVPALVAALRSAGFDSHARADIMRWKYTKLLLNLGNAVDALCGPVDGVPDAVAPLRAEGEAVLRAAGIAYASAEEEAARRGDLMQVRPVGGMVRSGGSTWQSLVRGSGVEADWLNGEIVRLGRLHGVPTPANETARQLINRNARAGTGPGTMTPDQFLAAIA